jgi:hypothetical protein
VKVWFDKATSQLLVEDETGRVGWDIYGVPLADVVFETRDDTARRHPLRGAWHDHHHRQHPRGQ